MKKEQDQLLEAGAVLWQQRTSEQLTQEDIREIAENLTGFFQLLVEWDLAVGKGQSPGAA